MNIKIEMFGNLKTFDFAFELKNASAKLDVLKSAITQPQIMQSGLIEQLVTANGEIYAYDYNTVGISVIIGWALNEIGYNKNADTTQAVLENSIEDTDWTAQRNQGLLGVFFRKITFSKIIQDAIISEANRAQEAITKAIALLEKSQEERAEKEAAEKAALINDADWKIEEKPIMDEGGKTSEYTHTITINGKAYTIIERNLFDVGTILNASGGGIYTKQSDKWIVTNSSVELPEDHQRAVTIVSKYGKFANSGIRM